MEVENQEIARLRRKQHELEDEANRISVQIVELQSDCQHELDPYPKAWWCKKCGAPMK